MITIVFDAKKAVKALTTDVEKQLRFALQQTLNRTAESRQRDIQRRIISRLTIRKGTNLFRESVRFAREDRADRKQDKFNATIRIIGSPQLKAERDKYRRIGAMIIRQDSTATHESSAIYRTPADKLVVQGFTLPAPGLRGAKATPLKIYPHNIGVTQYKKPDGNSFFAKSYKGGKYKRGAKKGQFKANTRFYFVKEGVGIFVREQVGTRSEYDALWFFRKRINVPNRLQLEEGFREGLDAQLQRTFDREFANALRTAK